MFFLLRPGERQGKEKPRWRRHGARAKTQGVFFFGSGPGERQGKEKRRWAPARGQSKKNKHHPGCVFFFYCGRRQGKEKLRWAPARGQSKKKHHPGCFFFGSGLRERQGKEKPRWAPARGQSQKKNQGVLFAPALGAGTGPEQKKHHPGCFFFCSGPGERQGKEKLRWAPARGQSKKKNTTQGVSFFDPALGAGTGPEQNKKNTKGVFFAPAPGQGRGRRSPVGRRHGARAKTQGVFFCSGPGERQGKEKRRWAPARGQSKKINTTQGVCFFLVRPKAREGEAPLGAGTGPEPKKKHHPGCCFFLLRPRGKAGEEEAPLGAGTGPEQKKEHHPW